MPKSIPKKVIAEAFELVKETGKKAAKEPVKILEEVPKQVLGVPGEEKGEGVPVTKIRRLQQDTAKKLAEWRKRKAKILGEIRAARLRKEHEEEERKRLEELEKKREEEKKELPSGEEALAATGAAQKKPTGLWGIFGRAIRGGRKFLRTIERKGWAPK